MFLQSVNFFFKPRSNHESPDILDKACLAKTKMSGFFGQELFRKNAKVRIFWSPDFKQTTVIIKDRLFIF